MATSADPDGPDRLDEIAERFAAAGYAPEGAELPAEGGDAAHGGHDHDHVHGHDHGGASLREFEYRGHTVQITTRYEVTIDGEPWTQPIQVRPNGTVICHALPAYVVPSANDLVQAVIDQSFEAPEEIRAMVEEARREEA